MRSQAFKVFKGRCCPLVGRRVHRRSFGKYACDLGCTTLLKPSFIMIKILSKKATIMGVCKRRHFYVAYLLSCLSPINNSHFVARFLCWLFGSGNKQEKRDNLKQIILSSASAKWSECYRQFQLSALLFLLWELMPTGDKDPVSNMCHGIYCHISDLQ